MTPSSQGLEPPGIPARFTVYAAPALVYSALSRVIVIHKHKVIHKYKHKHYRYHHDDDD